MLRNTAHFTEYSVRCLLLWNAVRRNASSPGKALAIAAIISLLYAGSDEFHQYYVPGRHAALRDVAIDAAGIVMMVLMINMLRPKKRLRAEGPAG